MTEPQRVGTLEITQDESFQEREWKVQRVGWALMALIVVLALLGLFSTGPLSAVEREAGDGALVLEYERFVRYVANTNVSIEAAGSQAENGEIELWMSSAYFDAIELQGISPQPSEVREAGDRHIMVFLVDDPSTTLTVELSMRPREIGWISAEAGVVGGPSIAFGQLTYP